MSEWGRRTYGDPCRECGYSWGVAAVVAVDLVAETPSRIAALVANARGDERLPALTWTVTAYVAHIADNLRIWAERLAGITLGAPAAVAAYNENELANARSYSAMSLPAACWSLARATDDWGDAVRMAPVDLVMIHPEGGRLGRDEVIRINAHDAAHHTWDVERTLAAMR